MSGSGCHDLSSSIELPPYWQRPDCFRQGFHPDQMIHGQMNLLLSRLDKQQRRWYAAVESARLGHGGDRLVSRLTGLHVDTIRRGREELAASLKDHPTDRVRLPSGGRPAFKKGSSAEFVGA